MRPIWARINAAFVLAAPKVLRKRVATHRERAAWSRMRPPTGRRRAFEPAMVALDTVVRPTAVAHEGDALVDRLARPVDGVVMQLSGVALVPLAGALDLCVGVGVMERRGWNAVPSSSSASIVAEQSPPGG